MDANSATYVVGVDIGGTFTDCLVASSDGKTVASKVSSTPPDFSAGFFESIAAAAETMGTDEKTLLRRTTKLAHGTTAGINALVTSSGAKVGLLSTKGHGDAIRLMVGQGRVQGATIEEILDYSISDRPPPVIPKEQVAEITERVDFAGDVVVALQEAEIDAALDRFAEIDVVAIAISFLWSFRNPDHENRARDLVRKRFPSMFVSCSHEVSTRIGEYGRTVSTVMNAAIGPLMLGYIDGIVQGAKERGLPGNVLFAMCEGGLVAADEARKHPLDTVQSGPVAAVVGCAAAGKRMSFPNVIIADMGGTTLDAATVVEGEVGYSEESILERHRVYVRKVDVDSIGAGGGSIAWIHEETGTLRVGPQSAGARPGPICYGRGGTEVTVTDADLVLGILNPDRALAGGVKLDVAAARKGVNALATKLGMGPLACAAGIVEIVDSRMEDLIRRVTIQRGQDPRNFILWACGGASGAHAGLFGKGIGIREAVFPLSDLASVWSAYGLAQLEPSRTFQASVLFPTPFDLEKIAETFKALEEQAAAYSRSHGFNDFYFRRHADMKYGLQVYEVETPVPDGAVDQAWAEQLLENFRIYYDSRYGEGSGYAGAGAVLTALRVTVASPTQEIPLLHKDAPARVVGAQNDRPVYWSEYQALRDTPVYAGTALQSGDAFEGPGIVEYPNTTIAVRPGQRLRVDGFGNAVLTLGGTS